MRKISLCAVVLVIGACSSPSTVAPVSVPLQYKMQAKAGEFPVVDSCAAISDVRVTDARTDKTIGKRYVENKGDALRRAGANVGKSGAPTLRLTVDQINTTENVLHRSGYEGRIVMTAELTKGGTSCWKDRMDGLAEN